MRRPLFALIIILLTGALFVAIRTLSKPTSMTIPKNSGTISSSMQITSPAFENNGSIPSVYTCDGADANPPLALSSIPQNAKSLVLILDDPDAPGGTWDHWIVFNIPPTVKEIQENSTPQGVEGMTSWGRPGYGGPCPPSGTHHYHVKLYALDTMLSLTRFATKADVEAAMKDHILAQSELVGLYKRQ